MCFLDLDPVLCQLECVSMIKAETAVISFIHPRTISNFIINCNLIWDKYGKCGWPSMLPSESVYVPSCAYLHIPFSSKYFKADLDLKKRTVQEVKRKLLFPKSGEQDGAEGISIFLWTSRLPVKPTSLSKPRPLLHINNVCSYRAGNTAGSTAADSLVVLECCSILCDFCILK